MPRLTSAGVEWQTPPAEPRMASRAWRNLDRQVAAELVAIDRDLSAWAGHEPKAEGLDHLLDARLFIRPPDAMETWPAKTPRRAGRVDSIIDKYGENPW
jgi:hypothetical protein